MFASLKMVNKRRPAVLEDSAVCTPECGRTTTLYSLVRVTPCTDVWLVTLLRRSRALRDGIRTRIRGSRSLGIVREDGTLSTDIRSRARNAYRCRSRTRNVVDLGPRRRIRFARQRGCTRQRVFAVLRDRSILRRLGQRSRGRRDENGVWLRRRRYLGARRRHCRVQKKQKNNVSIVSVVKSGDNEREERRRCALLTHESVLNLLIGFWRIKRLLRPGRLMATVAYSLQPAVAIRRWRVPFAR